MMTCTRAKALLSGYVDHELTPDEMSEVRHHLFECNPCSAEYESLSKAKETIASAAMVEPSEDFLKFVACKPWELNPETTFTRRSRLLPWYKKRWVVASIAACIPFVMAVTYIEGLGYHKMPSFNDTSLADSFKAEHQRYDASSPYSNYTKEPGAMTVAEPDTTLGSSGGTYEEPFIVSVSRRIIE